MKQYLQQNWDQLTATLPEIKADFYRLLVQNYSASNRHYHNLQHIAALLQLTDQHLDQLAAPDTLRFTIWYHDAIYLATRQDNEEKSAELAREQLRQMSVDAQVIQDCYQLICATKTHRLPPTLDHFDARFLLDIDLSILAASPDQYLAYTQQIRREYRIYPKFLYQKGRKKVLRHFLDMDRIYLTDLCFNLYEQQARENMQRELETL